MKIAYNVMWIQPTFPPPGQEGVLPPLPQRIEANIKHVAAANPEADVLVWIDSQRLSPAQRQHFTAMEAQNLHIRDLRELPEYRDLIDTKGAHFFDQPNDAPRSDKNGLLWQQVDLARLMAALQTANEGYTQIFYADADITNLEVTSASVQSAMKTHGILLCNGWVKHSLENGLLGFTAERAPLVRELLKETKTEALTIGINGFHALQGWVSGQVLPSLGLTDIAPISFTPRFLPGKPVPVAFEKPPGWRPIRPRFDDSGHGQGH